MTEHIPKWKTERGYRYPRATLEKAYKRVQEGFTMREASRWCNVNYATLRGYKRARERGEVLLTPDCSNV